MKLSVEVIEKEPPKKIWCEISHPTSLQDGAYKDRDGNYIFVQHGNILGITRNGEMLTKIQWTGTFELLPENTEINIQFTVRK